MFTFILKHTTNQSYGTIDILWASVPTENPANNRYFFFWRKTGEARTRLIGEYPGDAINTDVIKECVRLADGIFVGWVSDVLPWPVYIERWKQ